MASQGVRPSLGTWLPRAAPDTGFPRQTVTLTAQGTDWKLLAASSLALVSVLFSCIAVGTVSWSNIKISTTTVDVGLWKRCSEASDMTCCMNHKYEDTKCLTGEVRAGTDFRARLDATGAFVILGLLSAFAQTVVGVLCLRNPSRALYIATSCAAGGALLCYGVGVIAYAHTMGEWFNCGREFCDGIQGCTFSWGSSLGLASTSLALSFLNMLLLLLPLCSSQPKPPPSLPGEPQGVTAAAPATTATTLPTESTIQFTQGRLDAAAPPLNALPSTDVKPAPNPLQLQNPLQQKEVASVQPKPEVKLVPQETTTAEGTDETWVMDEQSGLYWSDQQQLYLDPASNQYYDPASEKWYNPETGEWYTAAA